MRIRRMSGEVVRADELSQKQGGERGAWSAMSKATKGLGRMGTEEKLLELTIRSLMSFGELFPQGVTAESRLHRPRSELEVRE